MYKVFIDNREVNFTNNLNSIDGRSYIKFNSNQSVVHELIPLLSTQPKNESVYVYIDQYNFDLKIFFKEFIFVDAAGGIVQENDEFLFIKRNGYWDIPKGKLNNRESFEKAAQREIEEECGINNLILKNQICSTFHTYFFKNEWYLKKTIWYHFELKSHQETRCQEEEGITEIVWLPRSKFQKIYKNTFSSIHFVISEFINQLEADQIKRAIILLKKDEVIAIPTETVYGLAANGFSVNAIQKIYSLKNRPHNNPLILHCASLKSVLDLVTSIPEKGIKLANRFWPGPLTLLLPKNDLVPDSITAGGSRVGVRVPNHPLTLNLLKQLDFPLAAPSANKYGSISPTCKSHVEFQFGNEIPLILDGGPCNVGIESTIIGFEEEKTIIYRLGQITIDDVIDICGDEVYVQNEEGEIIIAPGMVKHHYAPKTKLIIVSEYSEIKYSQKMGVILFNEEKIEGIPYENQVILSSDENFIEASKNLYKAFYTLDELGLEKIFIRLLPEVGLGISINDRIRRAGLKE